MYYYIYYRVVAVAAADCKRSVIALQAEIHKRLGVCGRLLCKQDEPLLWMEAYENIIDTQVFERTVTELAQYSVALYIDGPRHIECFRDF